MITVETHRTVLVGTWRTLTARCTKCGTNVATVTLEEAMSIARVTDDTPPSHWHLMTGHDGAALVCVESLSKLA